MAHLSGGVRLAHAISPGAQRATLALIVRIEDRVLAS